MAKGKVTPEIVREMRRLRGEGLSYGKIARRLGLNPMTVYSHLRKRPGPIERLRRGLG